MFGGDRTVYVGAQTLVCKVPRGPEVYLSAPPLSRSRGKAQRLDCPGFLTRFLMARGTHGVPLTETVEMISDV